MNIPEVRCDSEGHGYFGAPRVDREHNGVDFIANEGDPLRAFVEGEVTKIGYPYGDDLSYRYVQITDKKGQHWRYFYVTPHQLCVVGKTILQHDTFGYAQDVTARYAEGAPEMQNHYHLEVMVGATYIDPIPLIARA